MILTCIFLGLCMLCSIVLCKYNLITIDNLIQIISIISNIFIAIYIVRVVQNKLNTKSKVTSYCVDEIILCKKDYSKFLNNLRNNKLSAAYIMNWFKIINTKIKDICDILALENPYVDTSSNNLIMYLNELRDTITDSEEFTRQFEEDKITFSENFIQQSIISKHTQKSILFIKFIVEIHKK